MTGNDSFYLRSFHEKSLYLLEEDDREILHNILKNYQQYHDVTTLVATLSAALDSPDKLDLLKDIRCLLPLAHLHEFDRLAPFARMANPIRPPKVKTKKQQPRAWGQRQHLLNGINIDTLDQMGSLVTVQLDRESCDESLGFTIRGGSEHGLGIFVSQVEQGSMAEKCGLCVGDQIMEINGISLHSLSSSTALHVLSDSPCLRMQIKRLGKVPGFKFAKEKTAWYDVSRHRIVQGSLNAHGAYQYPSNKRMLTSDEFRVHLRLDSLKRQFGFNIRGGSEYGLGIFISSVDPGGLAESRGLKPGQQLVDVNGVDFESICHALAVEIIRSSRQLVLTMRDVGRYPAYKELYAKYSWHAEAAVSAGDSLRGGRARSYEDLPAAFQAGEEADLAAGASSLRRQGSTPSLRSLRSLVVGGGAWRELAPLVVEVHENKGTQTFLGEAAWPEDDDVTLVNRLTNASSTVRRKRQRPPLMLAVTVPQPRDDAVEHAVRTQFETEQGEASDSVDDVMKAPDGESANPTRENSRPKAAANQPQDSPARSAGYASVHEERIVPRSEETTPSILCGQANRAAVVANSVPALLRPTDMARPGQIRLKAFRPRSDPGPVLLESPTSEEPDEGEVEPDPESEAVLESPKSDDAAERPAAASLGRKSTLKEKLFGAGRKSYKLSRKTTREREEAAHRSAASCPSGPSIFARLGVRMRRQRSEDAELRRDLEAEVAFPDYGGVRPTAYRQRDINELAVEEMVRKLFSKSDRKLLLRNVAEYAFGQLDVESLGRSVLYLLAKPEQVLIIRELRGLLRPTDIGRFDSMVGPAEVAAYEELASRKAAKAAKLSPCNGQAEGPPKRTIMEPVPDNRGHYYLQTPEEFRLGQERRLQLEQLRREKRSPRLSPAAPCKLYLKKHEGKKSVRIRDAPADIEVIPSPEYDGSVSDEDDPNAHYDLVSFPEPAPPPEAPEPVTDGAQPVLCARRGGKYAVVKLRQASKPPGISLADSFAFGDSNGGLEDGARSGGPEVSPRGPAAVCSR